MTAITSQDTVQKATLYENGIPMPATFKLRDIDEYLSVNWLKYFGMSDVKNNMAYVRKEFDKHREITNSGRFAVLNVDNLKSMIKNKLGKTLYVKNLQEEEYPSHAGIEGYTNDDDVRVMISEMIRKDDMYPGKV